MWTPLSEAGGSRDSPSLRSVDVEGLPLPVHLVCAGAVPCRNEHRPRGGLLQSFEADLREALFQTSSVAQVLPTPVVRPAPHLIQGTEAGSRSLLLRNPYRHCGAVDEPGRQAETRMDEDAAEEHVNCDSDDSVGPVSSSAPRKRAHEGDSPPSCKRRRSIHFGSLQAALTEVEMGVKGVGADARSLFHHYHRLDSVRAPTSDSDDEGELWITGRGLEALEHDLGWPQQNSPCVFALLFSLGTKYLHQVSLSEWMRALYQLGAVTIGALRQKAQCLHESLTRDRSLFIKYTCYVFKYINKSRKRTMETSLVQRLLRAIIGRHSPYTESFVQFLNIAGVRTLNFDQCRNFLPFSTEIREDFLNYSVEDAWPSIYDAYVEWRRQERKQERATIRPSDGGSLPVPQRRRLDY